MDYNKKRRNSWTGIIAGGGSDPVATLCSPSSDDDLFAKLPDELALEIFSRLGSLNQAARCSLLCKRLRDTWRSIDGGVLDFDKFDELRRRTSDAGLSEERIRFADRVDQARAALLHHDKSLDALRIGFDFWGMEDKVQSWIEFGLTKGVKELTLSSQIYSLRGPVLNKFLTKHDLSRLKILEFDGLWPISQRVLQHILSNSPSLIRFALRRSSIEKNIYNGPETVVRVCSNSNNLQSLNFFDVSGLDRVEIISAMSLRILECRGDYLQLKVGDNLPRLQEARLCFSGEEFNLQRSRSQFSKVAPRLERLVLQVRRCNHDPLPHLASLPKWLSFEKLKVLELDLLIFMDSTTPPSFLDCTVLLRAAPMLQQLSIWLECRQLKPEKFERRDLGAESSTTWKHHSLKMLQLHGVRLYDGYSDARKIQLELAAYIIMRAPFLKEVLIGIRKIHSIREFRRPHEVDAHIREVKMLLKTLLQGHSASSQINFTYQ